MTSPNQIFGFMKSRAKSVRETARSGLEKITESMDKKLKEVQEDLEKQRAKVEAAATVTEQHTIWRPSEENPDGKIVTIVAPTPPPPRPPSPTISTHSSSEVSLDAPQATVPLVEPPTIAHMKHRRGHKARATLHSSPSTKLDLGDAWGNERRNRLTDEKADYRAITQCLNSLIDDIVRSEDVHQCLADLTDIVSTIDQLATETVLICEIITTTATPVAEEELVTEDDSESSDEVKLPSDESVHESFTSPLTNDAEVEVNDLTIEQSSPTTSNEDVAKQTELTADEWIPSESTASSSLDELEDSFEKLTTIERPLRSQVEEPVQEAVDLTALRELIFQIEEDANDDKEKETSYIEDAPVLIQNAMITNELLDEQSPLEDTFPSTESPSPDIEPSSEPSSYYEFSILLDKGTHELPVEETKEEETQIERVAETPVEKKRFSVVHSHSLPPATRIEHLSCSATYLYVCTADQSIFYAKLNLTGLDLPLQWQKHSDSAHKLVVSLSNQTVWRLHGKRLYASHDSIKLPPIGSQWNEIKIEKERSFLSMSVNDQCGWYIKDDGSLWLLRTEDNQQSSFNVTCPFNLNAVVGFAEKIAVSTADGEILIRIGCTLDRLEGDGWIFIPHNSGPLDDFALFTNQNAICTVDRRHRFWIHQWSSNGEFFEVLCNDETPQYSRRYLTCANADLLCFTDSQAQIHLFSDAITGTQWTIAARNTRLQRLIGAFCDQNCVWALNTDRMICSSDGLVLEKPRQAQYLTHASFVPDVTCQGTTLWTLDESCSIYVRTDVLNATQWNQLDQIQFEWTRRMIHMVCNSAGVWAVDDHGHIHFRHGHACSSHSIDSNDVSVLPPAWITIPGSPEKQRTFSQIYCGPADWMVYATDNKQTVYARLGISEDNRVGISWKAIEECSALELAISEDSLWLLTSCGRIQCRENISSANPAGLRSTTLSGLFRSLAVSIDDHQVWALDSKRNLLKLDRLTILFEK